LSFTSFLNLTVNGITVGMIYALIALGYTMVYGILEFINFAHGEVFTFGGYFGAIFLIWIAIDPTMPLIVKIVLVVLVFIFSIIATSMLGETVYLVAYKPLLRKSSRIAPLLSAIGVSIVLQNLLLKIFGTTPITMPVEAIPSGFFVIGDAHIRYLQLIIIAVTSILMFALSAFVKKSKMGQAMRATSQDIEAAEMMGINTNKIISLTFIIGSALAAIAGILVCMYYGTLKFDTGFLYGLKAFTACVLGGIGNIPGAFLGSLLIGLIENYSIGLHFNLLGILVALAFLLGAYYQLYLLPKKAKSGIKFIAPIFSKHEEEKIDIVLEKKSKKKSIISNEEKAEAAKAYFFGPLLIASNLKKKNLSSFVAFHINQSIKISVFNLVLFIMTILMLFIFPKFQISSQWKDVVTYLMLILILTIKPAGLLGESVSEKV